MTDERKYNGKTWEEWDETEYDCPQEGCGRETSHVEEGYFQCRCGWFGEPISIIEDLKKEVERLLEEIKVLSKYRDIVEKKERGTLRLVKGEERGTLRLVRGEEE
jgi:hypothetical protein